MWKLYAKSNEAIAVKTTIEALTAVLPPAAHVGEVKYIDFETATMPVGNMLYPFVHKRLSFEHEREVRAILPQFPEGEVSEESVKAHVDGHYVRVELETLIQEVYVAPLTPFWFQRLVAAVCSQYGLQVPIRRSTMDVHPLY
jgi:hypothetical protein